MILCVLVVVCIVSVTESLILKTPQETASGSQLLLPSVRSVHLQFTQSEPSILHHPETPSPVFSTLLKRRDDLELYGKPVQYNPNEANFAALQFYPSETNDFANWDATLLLKPADSPLISSCFVAMNRFCVKDSCFSLFEERWAERNTQLPGQSGFVWFTLLRRRKEASDPGYNYASCTLWASQDAWQGWRNGDGRYSHDASKTGRRTPVSEWMVRPASPIFWDGYETLLTDSGV